MNFLTSFLLAELANLKDLISEYRDTGSTDVDLGAAIWNSVQKSGISSDVPLFFDPEDKNSVVKSADLPVDLEPRVFNDWIAQLADYLVVLQERLFSSGLHVLGESPSDDALTSYLEAYFGDKLSVDEARSVVSRWRLKEEEERSKKPLGYFVKYVVDMFNSSDKSEAEESSIADDAFHIVSLLSATTEEMDSVVKALDGGYVPAAPGGDLLRDGPSVLPTGRNIHALDPYRMPSAGAWARGQRIAKELIKQHQNANAGQFPETVAVTLWGLDAIKTRGESVAIALALAGARPVKEGEPLLQNLIRLMS